MFKCLNASGKIHPNALCLHADRKISEKRTIGMYIYIYIYIYIYVYIYLPQKKLGD